MPFAESRETSDTTCFRTSTSIPLTVPDFIWVMTSFIILSCLRICPVFRFARTGYSAKGRRDRLQLRRRAGMYAVGGGEKIRMAHAGTDKGPAQRLVRCRDKHIAFGDAQRSAGRLGEAFGIQLGLLGQPAIEESPDFEIGLNRFRALLLAALGGNRVRH